MRRRSSENCDRWLQRKEPKVGVTFLLLLGVPMGALLHQALMLGTALLLALQPGWCCLLPQAEKTLVSPSAMAACCADHSAPPLRACPALQSDNHPPAQASVCCCATDNPLREGSEKARTDLTTLPLAAETCAGVPLAAAAIVSGFTPFAASAPLQLLHCVWLC
jgi:hypothetical protein